MSNKYEEKDLELWDNWKTTESPQSLQKLFKQFEPLLARETSRWKGVLAPEVLELEAARLAKQAFKTYDPKYGAKLSTHLTNNLQKLSRITYTHANTARIPEYQTLKIRPFINASRELSDQYGRPPSNLELAEHLGWSEAAIAKMQTQLRKEDIESVGTTALPMSGRATEDPTVDYIYHDLTPMQKKIFEHTTGYGGVEILAGKALMDRLHITQGQLSYEKKKIIDRIKDVNY